MSSSLRHLLFLQADGLNGRQILLALFFGKNNLYKKENLTRLKDKMAEIFNGKGAEKWIICFQNVRFAV